MALKEGEEIEENQDEIGPQKEMIPITKKKVEEPYASKKLRIGKYYDVDQCVATKPLAQQVSEVREKLCSAIRDPQFYKRQLYKRVPMVEWLITYKLRAYLQADIVSGFTVGIMNIPQGMGYAMLASLPPVAGLYISFFPILIYGILGTSRHLAIGSIAIVSLLSGGVVDSMVSAHGPFMANGTNGSQIPDTDALNVFKFKVVCSLSLLVGILQVLMGCFGLGILSSYFSQSFISGYMTGSAIQVLVTQIKELFGLKGTTKYNNAFKVPLTIIDLLSKIGTTNFPTLILSAISMVYLIIFKEFVNPIVRRKFRLEFPTELLLVVVTTVMSANIGFQNVFNINIVGVIPKGLPSPQVPDVSFWPKIIQNAIIISLIAFSINASLGTLFARKHKYRIYPTQELLAYGCSNIFASFFSCYPSAASLSRSSVLEGTGGKTPFGPLLSSIVILFVILFLNPYFQPLPNAVLASIITVALKTLLFQCKDLVTFWRYSKLEALVWLASFLGVVLLDVDVGLVIGLLVSLLTVIIRDQLVKLKGLKKQTDSDVYVDKDYVLSKSPRKLTLNKPDEDPDLKWKEYEVFKIQSSVYYANSEKIKKLLEKAVEESDEEKLELKPVESFNAATRELIEANQQNVNNISQQTNGNSENSGGLKYLILDFAGVNHVDSDGAKMLKQLVDDMKAKNINIYICQFQDYFIRMLHKMKLIEFFDPYLYLTIQEAISDIERENFDVVRLFSFELVFNYTGC